MNSKINNESSSKSQGGMEYLILIAAVLITASITVILVTGALGERREDILIEQCRSAAAQCSLERVANPRAPCEFCRDRCIDQEEEPIFPEDPEPNQPTAIDCCLLGMEDQIYTGAVDASECIPELEAQFTYQIMDSETIQFTDQTQFTPHHPDYQITNREWDFGDGHTSTEQNPTHQYQEHKSYEVQLTTTGSINGAQEQTDTHTQWIDLEAFIIHNTTAHNTQQGQPLQVDYVIENLGPQETQTIQATTNHPDIQDQTKELTLQQGETHHDTFHLDIPQNAETGQYTATIKTEEHEETDTFQIEEKEEPPEPEEHTLTINTDGQGTTIPEEGTHTYTEGEEVTITADPDSGWEFNEWTGACTHKDLICEVEMDSDKTVTAHFQEEEETECTPGETQECTVEDSYRTCENEKCQTENIELEGEQHCKDDGTWGSCQPTESPPPDECTDDEDCVTTICEPGETRPCDTNSYNECVGNSCENTSDGCEETCKDDGSGWGPCVCPIDRCEDDTDCNGDDPCGGSCDDHQVCCECSIGYMCVPKEHCPGACPY